MRWLAVFVACLALVAAGCGGGSDESAASDETTVEETTASTDTTESTSTDTTSTETTESTGDTTTDLSGVLGDEDCLALASAGAAFAKALSGSSTGADQSAALDELASKVPDDIKADVETLAGAFSEYSSKIKDIGIAPGATPTAAQLQELQTALASIDQKDVTQASKNIEAWSKAHCSG